MAYRQPARRGALGFELTHPSEVELIPVGAGVKVEERRGGKTIGEIEIVPFQAALIIDRDGVLQQKACEVAGVDHAVAMALPGATGFCAEVVPVRGVPLPYVHVIAITDEGGVDGGLLVIVRSASPEWPAADAILSSMRLVNRNGIVHANDGDGSFPLVGQRS